MVACVIKFKIISKTIVIFLLFIFINSTLYSQDIYFYIGAAFAKPVRKIASLYNNKVHLVIGGAGRILNEMLLSKKGDLFLPGSDFYTDILRKKKLIIKSKKLIIQSPVFGVSENGLKKIRKFDDLFKENIKIAGANANSMALGRILALIEPFLEGVNKNIVVNAANISQIVNYIKLNIVDAGILFDSVARCNNIKYIKLPNNIKIKKNICSLSIVKYSESKNIAKKFFYFILKNKKIFKKYGFQLYE